MRPLLGSWRFEISSGARRAGGNGARRHFARSDRSACVPPVRPAPPGEAGVAGRGERALGKPANRHDGTCTAFKNGDPRPPEGQVPGGSDRTWSVAVPLPGLPGIQGAAPPRRPAPPTSHRGAGRLAGRGGGAPEHAVCPCRRVQGRAVCRRPAGRIASDWSMAV